MDMKNLEQQAKQATEELLKAAHLKEGDIFVVGCSSSEVAGKRIGKGSDLDVAKAVYTGIKEVLDKEGIYLAAQCCEHLNRCVIIEKAAVKPWEDIVNVVPQMHAGGSFSMMCYENFDNAVALETVRADAGMDIGDTLIGMHLREVAVPVRISFKEIGEAHVTCARTRPKFIGGERAHYDMKLAGGEIER